MMRWLVTMCCVSLVAVAFAQAGKAGAKFAKPGSAVIDSGFCRNDGAGTFGATFPSGTPDAKHPYLAFSIGPRTFMAKESGASVAPFKGPATYKDVLSSGNSGSGAFAGLATVTVNADGQTGTFVLKDGSVSAMWDCGATLK